MMEQKSEITTVKLQYPIPVPKPTEEEPDKIEMVYELTFRRLKLKDFKLIPMEEWERMSERQDVMNMVPFIALATDIPISSAEEIDMIDLEPVSEVAGNFFGKAYPQNGKTP